MYQPRLGPWGHAWRVLGMVAISVAVWLTIAETQSGGVLLLDLALGLPCFVLVLCCRRRWPVPVALVAALVATVSSVAAGPATLAQASVSTRRRWSEILPVTAVNLVGAEVFLRVQPPSETEPVWLTLGTNVLVISAVTAWGMYVGSRRELLWTLRMRAERAEAEQELRTDRARAGERARIAREMHDVLAHRISQISMHAGALSFRDDLSAEQMRESAGVIREKAHEALTDLRDVLGVLRDDRTGEPADAPQPTYCDVPALVEEARGAGLNVTFTDGLAPLDVAVPDALGRTLYRIVQEGMTNARKHAPDSRLTIEVRGSPEYGVDIELRNPVGFGRTETPGAGLGLVGLSERTELAGGRLAHRREGESFVLHGWLPWAT